ESGDGDSDVAAESLEVATHCGGEGVVAARRSDLAGNGLSRCASLLRGSGVAITRAPHQHHLVVLRIDDRPEDAEQTAAIDDLFKICQIDSHLVLDGDLVVPGIKRHAI